jgi:lysine 2,3-aminomutase
MKKSHFTSDADVEPPSQESEPPGRMRRLAKLSLAKQPISPPRCTQPFLLPPPEQSSPLAAHPVRSLISFKISSRSRSFYKYFYPHITSAEWNDWHWQLCNRITDIPGLSRFIMISENESKALTHHAGQLPVSITPYYASLIDSIDVTHPVRRTVVPAYDEFIPSPGESSDPLAEDRDSPAPGIVHRYPDRALFLVTGFCFTHCRYCTRSRIVGNETKDCYMQEHWEQALAYIEAHPAIRDVLLSGGDPLTLEDESLEWLLSRLRRIPHVEFIRIGTKAPMVLPQRITSSLTRLLMRFHPLWLSIHVTHPEELTPEASQACGRLADAGIPLGSQTVLLAGVNDSIATMQELVHGLLRIRVKPYYLYQCDPIHGSAHFRTPVEKGLEIIQGLRGHTTGYAVPTFVVDAPGGGGKIPLVPDYVVGRDGEDLLLKNYAGITYRYPDPGGTVGLK